MKIPFEPFGTTLVLRELLNERKGVIVLPDTAKTPVDAPRCEVVAVGPGFITDNGTRIPCEYQVGDIISITRVKCNEWELDGFKYLICDQRAAIGKHVKEVFKE